MGPLKKIITQPETRFLIQSKVELCWLRQRSGLRGPLGTPILQAPRKTVVEVSGTPPHPTPRQIFYKAVLSAGNLIFLITKP
jgi:hypothetical protein